MRSIQ